MKLTIYTLNVIGDTRRGWTVKGHWRSGVIEIPGWLAIAETPRFRAFIVKELIKQEILKRDVKPSDISVNIYDEEHINIDAAKTGEPLLTLEGKHGNPLTRREQAQIFRDSKHAVKRAKSFPAGSYERGEYTGEAIGMNFVARVHGPAGDKTRRQAGRISSVLRRQARMNPPHGEFQNVRDFKDYLENTLIPDLEEAGFKFTADDFGRLLMFLKMRRFDKNFVVYLKETLIPDLHKAGYHETAKDFSTGVKFLYDETDGGKRVGKNKNPAGKLHWQTLKSSLGIVTGYSGRLAIGHGVLPIVRIYRERGNKWSVSDGSWNPTGHSFLSATEAKSWSEKWISDMNLHGNPLTAIERKEILRVADEHDRDAAKHKSTDLRKFDAGTASGLREAVAIAGSRKNPARVQQKWKWWSIRLNGKHIDTIQYTADNTADDVRRSLIDHDGYNPAITVHPKKFVTKK